MINLIDILLKENLITRIMSGDDFLRKYGDFGNELAKVIFKPGTNIGSNLGKGSYWSYSEEGLEMYTGQHGSGEGREYADAMVNVIYAKLKPDAKIYAVDFDYEPSEEYEKIKQVADGIFNVEDPIAGLMLFNPNNSLIK